MKRSFEYYLSVSIGWLLSSLTFAIVYHEISFINIVLSLLPLAGVLIGRFLFGKSKFPSVIALAVGAVVLNLVYLFRLSGHIVIDFFSITVIVYFIMMTVFMTIAPTTDQNNTFGIRIPITLGHKEVWNRAHQFMSIIIAGFLPAYFLLIFFWFGWGRFYSSLALVILPLAISALYANIIGIPYEKAEEEELKKQIQKEQGYR